MPYHSTLFRSQAEDGIRDESVTGVQTCALPIRSEEHTSELQSHSHLVCRLLLEKKQTEDESATDQHRLAHITHTLAREPCRRHPPRLRFLGHRPAPSLRRILRRLAHARCARRNTVRG